MHNKIVFINGKVSKYHFYNPKSMEELANLFDQYLVEPENEYENAEDMLDNIQFEYRYPATLVTVMNEFAKKHGVYKEFGYTIGAIVNKQHHYLVQTATKDYSTDVAKNLAFEVKMQELMDMAEEENRAVLVACQGDLENDSIFVVSSNFAEPEVNINEDAIVWNTMIHLKMSRARNMSGRETIVALKSQGVFDDLKKQMEEAKKHYKETGDSTMLNEVTQKLKEALAKKEEKTDKAE